MADVEPGARFGPYEIIARLGQGGMGTVYRARDTRLNRQVAIKFLADGFQSRFQREAEAISALNHPNICKLYDVGPDYLVMEHVDGEPLKGPVTADEALRLGAQIAGALEAAHQRGILHRDLKPANILVTRAGAGSTSSPQVKLLDFGLAKPMAQDAAADVTQTRDGTIVGTVAYMSPEQAQGQKVDARSDIFSFGATLYELVSGTRAFDGGSMAAVFSSVLRDEPPPLASPLSEIVAKCLTKSPDRRYQTMAEVRAALEATATTTVVPPDRLASLRAAERPSIAVLPFANTSRDADDEYFSDGLSEEIITALTQIAGLKVIARTSAFAFKGKTEDIRQIATSLGVGNVLEGSVRRSGTRLRINAQLIQAIDGTQLWAQRYDREFTDVFTVQDDIASEITSALRVKLTWKKEGTRTHEPNAAAHEAYLRGLHQYRVHEPERFTATERFLEQAIELDPEWGDPHSVLAERYLTVAMFGMRPLSDAIPMARREAQRTLELRFTDPTAHAVLGGIAAVHDYDWQASANEFQQALASGAAPPGVHSGYGFYYLLPLGRFDEALEQHDVAIAVDPLNGWWQARRLVILMCAGRYDEAMAVARHAIASGRADHLHYAVLGQCGFFAGGSPDESLAAAEQGLRLASWHAGLAGLVAGMLTGRGEDERARTILAGMRGGMTAQGMVTYHLVRSEIDEALDWYERDIEQRQPLAAHFAAAGFLTPLRASPRWPALARAMNLPDGSRSVPR
jgi:serine/threonine protein kinase